MCGRSPRGFSLSWATNQAVDLSAQQKLDRRWENPGKNTATRTRKRKYAVLTSIWTPEDDLKSKHFYRSFHLEWKTLKCSSHVIPKELMLSGTVGRFRPLNPVSVERSGCLDVKK